MKTALVVIDVQNYFVNEKTKDLPAKITKFIEKNKFDYVLFTKLVNRKDSSFVRLLGWKKCFASPETDIHPVMSRFVAKDNLFEKSTYSIFKSKKFVKFLKKNDIKKLFLCGIDIDACVLASAYDGFDLGYDVRILRELSMSHHGKALDATALKIIEKNLPLKTLKKGESRNKRDPAFDDILKNPAHADPKKIKNFAPIQMNLSSAPQIRRAEKHQDEKVGQA